MNKVFLVGRLSADPILKTTNKGIEFVNITVAVNDLRNKNDSYFLPCVG
jgi:single-stranded DNA-binding protein